MKHKVSVELLTRARWKFSLFSPSTHIFFPLMVGTWNEWESNPISRIGSDGIWSSSSYQPLPPRPFCGAAAVQRADCSWFPAVWPTRADGPTYRSIGGRRGGCWSGGTRYWGDAVDWPLQKLWPFCSISVSASQKHKHRLTVKKLSSSWILTNNICCGFTK